MPEYDFYCKSCHKTISLFMKIDAYDSNQICPACNRETLTRIFSSFTFRGTSGSNTSETSPDYYKDPRNIGKSLEKRFQSMNMDIPPEIKQSIDTAREGVLPDSLKDLSSASPDSSYH